MVDDGLSAVGPLIRSCGTGINVDPVQAYGALSATDTGQM